jgi:transcriptional regulator with XRE-family HTH domain
MENTGKKRQPKDINIQIGDRCRRAREASGYTQERLAEMIDKTPQFVSDYERGVCGVSLPTIIQLCSVLSVSSDFILFGRETGNPVDLSGRIGNLSDAEKKIVEKQINLTIQAFHANTK